MERLITPSDYPEISGPLVFLAGPIQGARDWQAQAAEQLLGQTDHLWVASPRRHYLDGEFVYAQQVDWESAHLRRAAYGSYSPNQQPLPESCPTQLAQRASGAPGAILFWLAREAEHNCARAYAQTTRAELFEWKVRHEYEGVALVVGIEEGFTGARYIRRRFSQDCPGVSISDNLEEACASIVALCAAS